MKKIGLAALCFFAAVNSTQAAVVSGSVTFDSAPLGVFGGWTINYNSTDPALKLTSVSFDIGATNLFLDTTAAAPGALLFLDFNPLSGSAATGFSSISPGTAALRNGATTYTLNFNDFGTGESFAYEMDVDECSGPLGSILDCSIVNGNEFAGATVTFNFGAPGYGTYSRTATFANVPGGTEFDARASFESEVPEPTSWALIGSALAGLGVLRRKRQA